MAIATVLFPTLARFANRGEIDNLRATMANGMRQILFVLVPAAAAILVLSDPMIRLDLPARRLRRGADDAGRDRALLVRLLAAHERPLPAADPDLLQPAAALAGDRPGGDRPRRLHPRGRSPSTGRSASAASSPGPGSAPAPPSSLQALVLRREFGGLEFAPAASRRPFASRSPRRRLPRSAGGVWHVYSTRPSAAAWRPDRLARRAGLGARRPDLPRRVRSC